MTAQKPRQIACQVLLAAGQDGMFIESRLDREIARGNLSGPDRALCQELVYGVTRWQRTLDWLISQKTTHPPAKPVLAVLLRLGLYQMFWLDRIPDHAAVSETVELAKTLRFHSQAGFINAILRGFGREREQTRTRLDQLKATEPALGFSHPDWLCERWGKRWGSENLTKLLQWNNSPAPVYARVNTLRPGSQPLTDAWTAEGVVWREATLDWVAPGLAYQIEFQGSLSDLPSFREGRFYVQDPSTLLAASELNPKPGGQVLDLCAAPGGKTTFAAQLMSNQGRILGCDENEGRLDLLRENCLRLGITCVEAALAPEALARSAEAGFDCILVDAPCSNTGVMRRRVEARWRVGLAEIERLRQEQGALLLQAAPLLKTGGKLVYSTCSLEEEENEGVASAFLAAHPDYRLIKQRMLLPFQEGVDGAFVAVLTRE